MSHFYLDAENWAGDSSLVLRGEEARHCVQVRRHRVGDEISVLNGKGQRAIARIDHIEKDAVSVSVQALHDTQAPTTPVTLLQAIPKGDGMEWIIEKAVELGVATIVPVISERTIVRLDADDSAKKRSRWQKAAIEACKQCGQPWLPAVTAPCSTKDALKKLSDTPTKLIASLEPDARPLHEQLQRSAGPCAIAIGPEGDFSPAEYALFRSDGWLPLQLGPLTLRCETAAIVAVSTLSYHLSLPR